MRKIKFRIFENNEMSNLDCLHLPHEEDEIKLMQYTGLKDKAGVEIYEGDIVEDEYDNNLYFLWYSENHARYCISSLNVHNLNSGKRRVIDYGVGISTYKVIGNIYENNELLNVET